jgi:hypothetical protein
MGTAHRTLGGALNSGQLGRGLLQLASHERGALLWIPCLLAGTLLVLFAMRVAPTGASLFTRTTGLRIVIGPCAGQGTTPDERAACVAALRRTLVGRGDLAVVDSARVERALTAAGPRAAATEGFLHAVRPLNPHVGLWSGLDRLEGGLRGTLAAYDVHSQQRFWLGGATGSSPAAVGRALADSLLASLETRTPPAFER